MVSDSGKVHEAMAIAFKKDSPTCRNLMELSIFQGLAGFDTLVHNKIMVPYIRPPP